MSAVTLSAGQLAGAVEIGNWSFDWISAVVTGLGLPLLAYLLSLLLKFSKHWVGYAVEGALYLGAGLVGPALARSLTLTKYCRISLEASSKYLYVPSRQDVRLPIDDMLVPLTLTTGTNGRVIAQKDVLSVGDRLLVIGDPGSGKSSLSKWLFRNAARDAIEHPGRGRFPLLFELKNITEQTSAVDLYNTLRSYASEVRAFRVDDCFDALVREGGLLLILDGLDEVSSNVYTSVEHAIVGLSRTLAGMSDRNVLVLTMRSQFHLQVREAYRDSFGATLTLRPFREGDIFEFLHRWPFPEPAVAEVNRIFGDLSERPSLKEMCRNPLVLAMYVAEDHAGGAVVPPDSRSDFYAKVCDELLLRRRLAQLKQRPQAPIKLKEQRERILGRLAFEHLLDPGQAANLIGWQFAEGVVNRCLGRDVDSGAILRELCKETGLISEESAGQSLRFIHLTFCEYFAALYAVSLPGNGVRALMQAHSLAQVQGGPHNRARLREAIPFAAGLSPVRSRMPLLAEIASMGDDDLLLACLLETKAYEAASWTEVLHRRRSYFLESEETDWSEEWLRSLHLFGMVLRDARACALYMPGAIPHLEPKVIFEALMSARPGALAQLLEAYALYDAAAAFTLAEGYGHDILESFPELVVTFAAQRPFFELVRARVASAGFSASGISVLAEAGLRNRTTAEWLNALPQQAELVPRTKAVRAGARWTEVRKSFFTQCLTLADSGSIGDHALLKTVDASGVPLLRPKQKMYLIVFFIPWIGFGLASGWYFSGFSGLGVVGMAAAFSSLAILGMMHGERVTVLMGVVLGERLPRGGWAKLWRLLNWHPGKFAVPDPDIGRNWYDLRWLYRPRRFERAVYIVEAVRDRGGSLSWPVGSEPEHLRDRA